MELTEEQWDKLVLSEEDLIEIPLEGGDECFRFYEAGVYQALLLAGYSDQQAGGITDCLREAHQDLYE